MSAEDLKDPSVETAEQALASWRAWAQVAWLGGGAVSGTDDDLRMRVCAAADGMVTRVQDAIRAHRDLRGDDRCWLDDERLYATLPDGYVPPPRDTAVEIDKCRAFIENRRHPATVYVSPQREIDRLRALLSACDPPSVASGTCACGAQDGMRHARACPVWQDAALKELR